jgi:hypothetical protein
MLRPYKGKQRTRQRARKGAALPYERLRFSGHSMLCPYKTEYRKRQRARTARRRMLSYGNFLETRLGAN